MKVSIITTIYKAEKDLPRLLDSMMALKSPELEFFLIDNGSPDRCGDICAEYAKRDSRFFVRTINDNIGYIKARMLGIRECHGDYVGFSDSDDYLEPGGYDHAIETITKTNCDLYITAYNVHVEEKVNTCLPPYLVGVYEGDRIIHEIRPQAFGFRKGKDRLHGFMWKQIYRKSILLDNKITLIEGLKPWEDQVFNIDVIDHCERIYVDNRVIYNYFANSESITAKVYANFDAADFWKKTRQLFVEKICRTSCAFDARSSANASLFNLYSLVVNLCKYSPRSTKDVALEIKSLIGEDAVAYEIVSSSSINDLSWHLLFVKCCISLRCFRFLVCIVRNKLKKK